MEAETGYFNDDSIIRVINRERATAIVFNPPFPVYLRPVVETVNFMTIALLPVLP